MPGKTPAPYDFFGPGLFYPSKLDAFQLPAPTLDPDHQQFSLANAWWLSNLSHLAYHTPEQIKRTLIRQSAELLGHWQVEETFCYLAKIKSLVVLAFRGTQFKNKTDAKTDINFPLTDNGSDTCVHRGFNNAINLVWPLLEPELTRLRTQEYRFWFTGHSLGAALATLACYRFSPDACYTFGSPRVGNRNFSDYCRKENIFRVINCNDLVCTLPPAAFGFVHAGRKFFINSRFEILENPSRRKIAWLKAKATMEYSLVLPVFRKNHIWFRSLIDHSIVNYNIALWNSIQLSDNS